MRDNDDTTIPSAAQSTVVKNELLKILPANTDESDLFVSGPAPVSQDFTFSALSPNTSTMRSAITANLQQLFAERTDVGADVVSHEYTTAIFNTLDTTNGAVVDTFTLTVPTPGSDIAVASGEIAVLGTVTYPT
jgi:uncharacterized phage protein gp47/JayE